MKKTTCGFLLAAALFLLALPTSPASAGNVREAAPMDWPHWRGPELNGISREKNLVEAWDPEGGEGSHLLWKSEELASRSTPIVMNGRLYMLARDNPGTDREGERVVCVDPATGKIEWETRFEVFLSDVPNTRVGWSSLVGDPATGNVFALGVCDYFACLDGKTGKTLWSHSLSEEYGMLNTYGGRTNFPIVRGNLVIISGIVIGWGEMAKPAHRFIAFDTRNGQPVWFEGTRLLPYDTTYSSAITTVVEGKPMLVFGSGDGGVHAFEPMTGRNIWSYDVSRRGINTTPLVIGDRVYCGHSEENIDSNKMGAFFCLDATKKGDITKTGEIWKHEEWYVGKSSPIEVDGRIYAFEDDARLIIADAKTGKRLGDKKLGTVMRSSPLYADGKIYCCTANGRWYTLKPDGDGVEVLHRMRLNGESSYASPIVSHGRLFVPTTDALYCIGETNAEPLAEARPEPPQPTPVEKDLKPDHVQVVPVESLLKPRQAQQFQVRLFNANGQFVGLAEDVQFSIEGPGKISPKGLYETADGNQHAAVTVTAKVGGLSGTARIRVIPDLPWNFDFSSGEVPITWVGARYRHIAIDFTLWQKLKDENPRASELYVYLLTGFTNSGRPALTLDDGTPRQTWTALLRFLHLADKVTNLEQAKKELDPALKLLVQEGVLGKADWSAPADVGTRLQVTQGKRPIVSDGDNGVMCKITTIPKGTRSQGWMGPDDFQNYTIQADVFGTSAPVALKGAAPKFPDIGVQAQRYRLELRSADQDLQGKPGLKLYSWIAHEIKYKTVPFEWEPDRWYTMKLQTSVEERDGKPVAVLRGKAWPRDEKEPSGWVIEWTDAPANTHGAPGLFGEATNAEIFYDNIKVSPNTAGKTAQAGK